MRLFAMTALVMVAFAVNSVLNRAALATEQIDPVSFALIRTLAGALTLVLLVLARDRVLALRGPLRLAGGLSLSVYMLAFSVAYVSIETGVGALILFGGAQVTMFLGAVLLREPVPIGRWVGAGLALVGLIWLLLPGARLAVSVPHGLLMLAAALGWGIYSLVGQRAGEPLRATAANFLVASGVCILATGALLSTLGPATAAGLGLAVLSGAVTSAMAYALWYMVLPQLSASTAGLSFVTVPVIALAGGVLFLGEAVSLRMALASALVLGGVALGVLWRGRPRAA